MRKPTDAASLDRSYRRGTVLGLSLAELFIILVFLLLLIPLIMSSDAKDTLDEKNELYDRGQIDGLADGLEQQKKQVGGHKIDNVNISELIAAKEKEIGELANDLKEEKEKIERLDNLIAAKDKEIGELANDLKKERDEIERLDNSIGKLSDDLKQQKKRASEYKIDNDKISDLIAAKEKEIERLHNNNDRLVDNLKKERGEIERLADAHASMQTAALKPENSDPYGQDSPCWYEMSTRANGDGYEKHLYIFDIQISDDFIRVENTASLLPRRYKEQGKELEYDRMALNRKLTYKELIPAFEALKEAGDNKKIRDDRRCAFTVRVWDMTSDTNKAGYQQAHDEIVQAIFNTLRVKEDPWPH